MWANELRPRLYIMDLQSGVEDIVTFRLQEGQILGTPHKSYFEGLEGLGNWLAYVRKVIAEPKKAVREIGIGVTIPLPLAGEGNSPVPGSLPRVYWIIMNNKNTK